MSRFVLVFLATLLFAGTAWAQTDALPYFNQDKNGLWVDGYDPVGYTKDHKAIKGKKEYAVTYKGTTFYTSSKENQELFKKSPEKYLPEYGGYCAFALGSYNEKVEVDPKTFKVIDGKAYLFYNKLFNNTLTSWNKDEKTLHANAEKNWTKFKHAPTK